LKTVKNSWKQLKVVNKMDFTAQFSTPLYYAMHREELVQCIALNRVKSVENS
jgi:hypothetical protein